MKNFYVTEDMIYEDDRLAHSIYVSYIADPKYNLHMFHFFVPYINEGEMVTLTYSQEKPVHINRLQRDIHRIITHGILNNLI